jgi:hypothetical protein
MLLSQGFANSAEELGISVHCLGHGRRADYGMARDFSQRYVEAVGAKDRDFGARLAASRVIQMMSASACFGGAD